MDVLSIVNFWCVASQTSNFTSRCHQTSSLVADSENSLSKPAQSPKRKINSDFLARAFIVARSTSRTERFSSAVLPSRYNPYRSMSLTSGSKFGPYEIQSPLGAGGMGEVYSATQSSLGRQVAIKVLASASALDPERLRRFEQEARAASALNHPNIISIYDVGRDGATSYIAMELVD